MVEKERKDEKRKSNGCSLRYYIGWLLWGYFLAQKMLDERGLFDGNRFLKSD